MFELALHLSQLGGFRLHLGHTSLHGGDLFLVHSISDVVTLEGELLECDKASRRPYFFLTAIFLALSMIIFDINLVRHIDF